jgi:hypothetical protein
VAGGSIQKGGEGLSVWGMVMVIAGTLIPGAQPMIPVGMGFMVAGSIVTVSGNFITPIRPDTGQSSKRDSPTYGFAGAQYANRLKGDATIAPIYGRLKQAPTIVQSFTTPRGLEDYNDFVRANRANGQQLSMELVLCEGPIAKIEDIQIDGSPVFDSWGEAQPDGSFLPKFLASGPGGSTTWSLELPGKRVYIPSIRLQWRFAGQIVEKGWNIIARTATFQGNGATTAFKLTVTEEIVDERSPTFVNQQGRTLDPDDITDVRPHVWLDTTGDTRTLFIDTGIPMRTTQSITMTYYVRVMGTTATPGISVVTDNATGITKLVFVAGSVPATSTQLWVSFQRYTFPGLSLELRYGGEHQLALTGMQEIRQTYAIGGAVEPKGTPLPPIQTAGECDDVILDFASSPAGMRSIDDTGSEGPRQVMVAISYRPLVTSPATVPSWIPLTDPAGASTAFSDPKSATDFVFWAQADSQVFWSLSIRGILRQLAAKSSTAAIWAPRLAAFTRGKYEFQLTRTNFVQHTGANALHYADELDIISRQEVLDEFLSHPGVAKIGLHGLATARLNNRLPNLTCVPTGLVNVRSIVTVSGVDQWGPPDAANQFNPVWAACDLITNRTYGGGAQYDLADIDIPSAKAAAAWCDEQIPLSAAVGSATERRARLDYSGDTQGALVSHVGDMLAPAFVIPVLQGDVWKFVIDGPVSDEDLVDTSIVPVFYDDNAGEDNATAPGAGADHEPLTANVTDLFVDFYDENKGWTRQPVLMVPRIPTLNRRTKRVEIRGCTRLSQATRYTQMLYAQSTAGPTVPMFTLTGRPRIDLEAGDVVRFVSQRLACDVYLRIVSMSFDSGDYFVKYETKEYRADIYNPNANAHARIITNPEVTATPSIPQLIASATRVA